jgi:hypothetical protein
MCKGVSVMYAMSWELNNRDYKYESIQHGYSEIDFYDEEEENEIEEISLEEIMEDGFDLEEEVF